MLMGCAGAALSLGKIAINPGAFDQDIESQGLACLSAVERSYRSCVAVYLTVKTQDSALSLYNLGGLQEADCLLRQKSHGNESHHSRRVLLRTNRTR